MRHDYDQDHRTRDRWQDEEPRRRHGGRGAFGWDRERGAHRPDRRSDDEDRRSSASRQTRDPRHDRNFGPDDDREGMPRDETDRLIASHKVEGTPVYDRDGKNLGTICTLMIDKRSGRTVYAVLRGRGFIGLVDRFYPLRWEELTYDSRAHGYGVDFDEDDLKHRPGFDGDGRRIGDRNPRSREGRDSDWW